VSDTGPGIAPADLEKIFEPFVQADDLLGGQEGTGLGLPISREFVRLMGGELTAASAPGEGTSFNFDLPLLMSSMEPAYAGATPYRQAIGLEPGQQAYRVLVVEDREYSRRLLEKFLSQLGLEVRSAVNGAEGVAMWQAWQPHVIFMDMRMPIMDGHEATQRIKALSPGQGTVIIALTASAFEEDRVLMLAEGCDDFVRKPFRPEDITETLRKHAGLRFVYADQPGLPLGTDVVLNEVRLDFAGVPSDWFKALRMAALQADGERLADLIDEVCVDHPAVAAALTLLVEKFDFDAILTAADQEAALRVES
jgi:CheY-like chemotaxis protein